MTQTTYCLHVSFVCPYSQQLENHMLAFCRDRSLISLWSILIFSSSRPFCIGIDTSTSDSICCTFLNASSSVLISCILRGALTWWSKPATYNCTKILASMFYEIWLSRSLHLLSYSSTVSPRTCLISFNFCEARCATYSILKKATKFDLISSFDLA